MLHLLLATLSLQQLPSYVQPATYVSEDRRFEYTVVPSDRDGRGEARYSFRSSTGEPWTRTFDFTLHDACVAEDGLLVGHGLSPSEGPRKRDVVLTAIEPDGDVRWTERTAQHRPTYLHSLVDRPEGKGAFVDEVAGEAVFWMVGWDSKSHADVLVRLDLETGERRPDLFPGAAYERAGLGRGRLHQMTSVPGTGLYLAAWIQGRWRSEDGLAFTLMEPHGEILWHIRQRDRRRPTEDEAASPLTGHAWKEIDLILGREDRLFEVWFPGSSERVTFELGRGPGKNGAWGVVERASATRSPEDARDQGPEILAVDDFESIALEPPPTIVRGLLEGFSDWGFSDAGDLLAVVRDAGSETTGVRYRRVRISTDGEVLESVPMPPLPGAAASMATSWFHLGSDRWLEGQKYGADRVPGLPRLVDGSTGSTLEDRDGRLPDRLAQLNLVAVEPTPGGGFVVLGNTRSKYSRSSRIHAVDSTGSLQWTLWESHRIDRTSAELFSPEDLAVTEDGRVVVVDKIQDLLQVYDADGEFIEAIELADAWDGEPNYPCGVTAVPGGAVLVHDSNGDPKGWIAPLDGTPHRPFEIRFEDGRSPNGLSRHARFSPDGSLWTTDRLSPIRVGQDGVVTETIGPTVGGLELPAARGVLPDGRILVQDRRSGRVFAWLEDGSYAYAATVDPGDAFEVVGTLGRLTSDVDGSVWVESTAGHPPLGWQADGARDLSGRPEGFLCTAPGGEFWCIRERPPSAELRSPDGELVRTIERTPNGRWFSQVLDATTTDSGDLLLLTSVRDLLFFDVDATLAVWPASGAAPREVDLPWIRDRDVQLRAVGDHVVVAGTSTQLTLVDLEGLSVRRFSVADSITAKRSLWSWAHGLSSDGRALVSVHVPTLTLLRYALP